MTPWTVAHLVPLPLGSFRQEYWSGWAFLIAQLVKNLPVFCSCNKLSSFQPQGLCICCAPTPKGHEYLCDGRGLQDGGTRLLGTNGGSLWLWCCLPQPGALPLGLAQRKRASPRGEAGTSGFLCVSVKRVASPGSMHDTRCLGLVHWDNPEGGYGEGGGRSVQDGEHMYTCGRLDRKSTRLNSSHKHRSRMPSSACRRCGQRRPGQRGLPDG